MQITVSKITSVVIALFYVGIAIFCEHGLTLRLIPNSPILLIPLALIWFPDEIGSFQGYVGRGGFVNKESPAFLITVLGWFFLVGLPIILIFLSR